MAQEVAADGARRGVCAEIGLVSIHLKRPRRLGTRLTLSYLLLLSGTMLVFTAGTAAVVFFQMRAQLAHFAVQDIETVEGLISLTLDWPVESSRRLPQSSGIEADSGTFPGSAVTRWRTSLSK